MEVHKIIYTCYAQFVICPQQSNSAAFHQEHIIVCK